MHTTNGVILFRFILIIVLLVAIDFYAFRGIKTAFGGIHSERSKQLINWSYWAINILFFLTVLYSTVLFYVYKEPPHRLSGVIMGAFVLLFIPKLLLVSFLLVEDIIRLFEAVFMLIKKLFLSEHTNAPYFSGRRKFISQIGLALASVPFAAILYGITKGKYNYKTHRVNLKFKDLPKSFDGLTITQISDLHVGSFNDEDEVKRAVDIINEHNSDLLFFTGDLVNNRAEEMERWMPIFSELKAGMGKYSILGNHDYGDYISWETEAAKQNNLNRLKDIHKELGFNLLLNANTLLEKDGENISLIGVENWGGGGFAKYGKLNEAISEVPADSFKILLSHDPTHWEEQTLNHPKHVHLTLSGHTHGMQFGIEIPGFRWSPVKYRYPKWAGLYEEKNKFLYVNRGLGFIGFPGRVGIWPEITVITLQST